mmetsp:Transcript_11438/g.17301  ORF Transcript_11438/g.17301 Transcript_11438/m.17301 type:complete len:235 (-) Transcript_11438:805-1509(-)
MIPLIFAAVITTPAVATISVSSGYRRKDTDSEDYFNAIRNRLYSQSPIAAMQNPMHRPLFFEYPRYHVVHPDDHISSVIYESRNQDNSPKRSPYDTAHTATRDTDASKDSQAESWTTQSSIKPAAEKQTCKADTVDDGLPDTHDVSPKDMYQKRNPSTRVLRRLLSATFRFLFLGFIVSIVLTCLYSLYKRRYSYTKIDEYGNTMDGAGWSGVVQEFRRTWGKVLKYIWSFNPL